MIKTYFLLIWIAPHVSVGVVFLPEKKPQTISAASKYNCDYQLFVPHVKHSATTTSCMNCDNMTYDLQM